MWNCKALVNYKALYEALAANKFNSQKQFASALGQSLPTTLLSIQGIELAAVSEGKMTIPTRK